MKNAATSFTGMTSATTRPRFDARQLRAAAGQFATGVTVVTVAVDGRTHGMTANSFVSVSLDPPLVLVSVANQARMLELITRAESFGVSVLSEQQTAISQQFAGRGSAGAHLPLDELGGVPVIPAAIARFACRLHARVPGGDHTLILGEVVDLERRGGEPLLFFDSSYRAVRKVDVELAYASFF